MVNTLPGMKENPNKQFDTVGKEVKDTFVGFKDGNAAVVDKALNAQKAVDSAAIQIQKNKHGLYFEIAINLKKYTKGYKKFSYVLLFDNKGICTSRNLPSKEKNNSSPYPLNFERMIKILNRNKKALQAQLKSNKSSVAEK